MEHSIVICENPGGNHTLAVKIIPPTYLDTIFIPGTIHYENNEIQMNFSNVSVSNPVIINIGLNPNHPQQNIFEHSSFEMTLDIFCKYICCGLCLLISCIIHLLYKNRIKGIILFISIGIIISLTNSGII